MVPSFLPYQVNDGRPTLLDSTIIRVWNQLVSERIADRMFIEGDITSENDFLTLAKHPNTHFVLTYDKETDRFNAPDDFNFSTVFWLNRVERCRAACHFAVFKDFRRHSELICRESLKYCFELKYPDGTGINLIWGVIPAKNSLAIKFSLKCGAMIGCPLPNYIWRASCKKPEDGVLMLYPRGSHENLHKNRF